MEGLRALFVKPDPNAQMRKCNALIRSNIRKLDRDIAQVRQAELKTKNLILQADRRGQRNPGQARQAQREAREFARELIRVRRTSARLVTSKAQLSSVQMQVNEAFAVRRIEGSIRASVTVMRDVNALVRLPQLAGTMQELGTELLKAGVIEEMVGETLPLDDDLLADDDLEAEAEVDKVLGEILKGRMDKTGALPSTPPAAAAQPAKEQEQHQLEEEEEDQEAMMDQMRNRLEALRS
ncbi:Snf7 family protein [Durotheca rogersii]|uniref:Snf7 family protein n=1 Tax=Durotheca rogersii TaxID=419775 RepID=UPI002220F49A|nr:Snf7 family protein [Durotheca rogersii]KAI5863525.1 Snf7 family protein [Durotheca rogersii]